MFIILSACHNRNRRRLKRDRKGRQCRAELKASPPCQTLSCNPISRCFIRPFQKNNGAWPQLIVVSRPQAYLTDGASASFTAVGCNTNPFILSYILFHLTLGTRGNPKLVSSLMNKDFPPEMHIYGSDSACILLFGLLMISLS